MVVIEIRTTDELTEQLDQAGEKLIIIDFFATWCGPCKYIKEDLEILSEELTGIVVFLKVDVDEAEDLATEYDISGMPTFIFIKNKQKIDEFSGADLSKLKETVQKHK